MTHPQAFLAFLVFCFGWSLATTDRCKAEGAKIRYDRDIAPILSQSCLRCHGPDEGQREGGLRLDRREDALGSGDSGDAAIVPRQADQSEIIRRITTRDPNYVMPPPGESHSLGAREIGILRDWIDQGARWDSHWTFTPVRRPMIPVTRPSDWPLSAIDHFVLARLEEEGFEPSPRAEKYKLLRRVTFDLTGLPPTPQAFREYIADESPGAYDRVVDRLLASPAYGERFATPWLDLARYADTNGHFMDNRREMWLYRDWVVRALNDNMPFDQFTIEQIAGDLLPDATIDQKIASGFNRNHSINFEAGAIEEECQVSYVIDRVNTTSTVWLGLTVGCSQCHDHKYDPISQQEYFQLYAFFNNIEEEGVDGHFGNAEPTISVPTNDQIKRLADLKALEKHLVERFDTVVCADASLVGQSHDAQVTGSDAPKYEETRLAEPLIHLSLDERDGFHATDSMGEAAFDVDRSTNWTRGRFGGGLAIDSKCSIDLEETLSIDSNDYFTFSCWAFPSSMDDGVLFARMDDDETLTGFDIVIHDGRVVVRLASVEDDAINVVSDELVSTDRWHHIAVTYDGTMDATGIAIYIDGEPAAMEIRQNNLTDSMRTNASSQIGRRYLSGMFDGIIDEVRLYDTWFDESEARALARIDPVHGLISFKGSSRQSDDVRNLLCENLQAQRSISNAMPSTMVMRERSEKRPTHVLLRGKYDAKGREVHADVPGFLPPLEYGTADNAANRLSLARWLVRSDHPLTSRVSANRAWQHFFGVGIVRTPEDFGRQGDRPTHPLLLDWLAAELMDSGWDMKRLHRLIVTSATYQQASYCSKDHLQRDPGNKWLARMSRRRLSAEMFRDAVLQQSGLISMRFEGPSVFPYQPAGLWKEMSFRDTYDGQEYFQSEGESLYRRSLYTFWKRTCPPPNMSVFDAPSRDVCSLNRSRSNTPLQALVTMNDPTYVEAARNLAQSLILAHTNDDRRIEQVFEILFGRQPVLKERHVIERLLAKSKKHFGYWDNEAGLVLTTGDSWPDAGISTDDFASWTIVVSTLMNLDEAVMLD